MGRKTLLWGVVLLLGLGLALVATQPAWAQEPTPTPVIVEAPEDPVTIYATYPEMVIGVDEKATFDLTLKVTKAQKVQLEVANLPEGWEYEFRGGVRTVRAVYALPDDSLNLRLQVTPAKETAAGDYTFEVVAKGEYGEARFPLTITIKEKTPPKLELKVDLPTLKGSPNTNFRFGLTIKNESDQEITVSLQADAPPYFLTRFLSLGKEITSIPVDANGSKRIDLEVKPIVEVDAGEYPIRITVQGSDLQAEGEVVVVITGQPTLRLTTPTGRLSGEARAGEETTFKVIIENTGTAPAHNVRFFADAPSQWKVSFDPEVLQQLPTGEKVEVTVKVKPAAKAIAGDYLVTLRATSEEGPRSEVDFRVTVTTSTLWGLVGLGIIAVAVLVVAGAVAYYGRR